MSVTRTESNVFKKGPEEFSSRNWKLNFVSAIQKRDKIELKNLLVSMVEVASPADTHGEGKDGYFYKVVQEGLDYDPNHFYLV